MDPVALTGLSLAVTSSSPGPPHALPGFILNPELFLERGMVILKRGRVLVCMLGEAPGVKELESSSELVPCHPHHISTTSKGVHTR